MRSCSKCEWSSFSYTMSELQIRGVSRKLFFIFVYCYDLALLPSIICLGRFGIACRYIFSLSQLRQGVDFLAQWLEH